MYFGVMALVVSSFPTEATLIPKGSCSKECTEIKLRCNQKANYLLLLTIDVYELLSIGE